MSLLDSRFAWTEFFSVGADRKVEHVENLRELAERIRRTVKKGKAALPWFKGARFGDKRSVLNSLRTNINVLGVTALEADYDGKGLRITFDQAVAILRDAGIVALVYSTPSDSPTEPHWRVIAPLAREVPPTARQALQARLNGLLGGSLDPASFNLSLSYYFGSIPGKPRVKVELVDGERFIDEADNLDETAIGRHGANDDDILGPPRQSGHKPDISEEDAERLLMAVPNDDRFTHRDEWRNVIAAIHHQFDGSPEGLELALRWSAGWTGGEDNPDYTEATYESLIGGGSRPKTFLWIIQLAGKVGVTPRARDLAPEEVFDDISGEFEDDNPGHAPPVADTEATAERGKKALEAQLDAEDPLSFNSDHAMVLMGGKFRVVWELDHLEFMEKQAFKDYNADKLIRDGKRTIAKADAWLQHPAARRYNGVAFEPSGKLPNGYYNMWRGWFIQPDKTGSCDLFLQHLWENVCQQIESHYEYLLSFLAHIIQCPDEKPGVAIVLRGLKGVGKDVVGYHIGKLVSPYFMPLDKMKHLTGNFNAHLAQALVAHIEETIWAGNHEAENILKSFITREQIAVEGKGKDVVGMRNFTRLILSSNATWVVPASWEERRWLVLDVGQAQMQNTDYFKAIDRQMRHGGYGRLMHDLMHRDLSHFDVRKVVRTKGLTEQIIATLRGVSRWWFEILESGELLSDSFNNWPEQVQTDLLYRHFQSWLRERPRVGHGESPSVKGFGMALSKLCPSSKTAVIRDGDTATRARIFPSLEKCREDFEQRHGQVEWGE